MSYKDPKLATSPQKPTGTAKEEKTKKRFSIFGTGKKKEMEDIKNELQNMNAVVRTPIPTPQPNKSVFDQVITQVQPL